MLSPRGSREISTLSFLGDLAYFSSVVSFLDAYLIMACSSYFHASWFSSGSLASGAFFCELAKF